MARELGSVCRRIFHFSVAVIAPAQATFFGTLPESWCGFFTIRALKS